MLAKSTGKRPLTCVSQTNTNVDLIADTKGNPLHHFGSWSSSRINSKIPLKRLLSSHKQRFLRIIFFHLKMIKSYVIVPASREFLASRRVSWWIIGRLSPLGRTRLSGRPRRYGLTWQSETASLPERPSSGRLARNGRFAWHRRRLGRLRCFLAYCRFNPAIHSRFSG